MPQIVWSAATAHTAAMLRDPGAGESKSQADRVFDGFSRLRDSLHAAKPDIVVIIAGDHFMTFSYENMPIFALATGDKFETWGEFGTPNLKLRGDEAFGDSIHASLVGSGFDVMGVSEGKIDHSFSCPIEFLGIADAFPILPVYVNSVVPPLPSFRRSLDFGYALGNAIRGQKRFERIAILGTGGLSHWVGTPNTGEVNDDFDRSFLDRFEALEFETLADMNSDDVMESAGNAAGEVRNWLIAAAATDNPNPERLAYEPVSAWKTGIALVDLRPQ